jgi:hypothetical protein
VIVASKFDNRLKEFGERWEVDKYLSASGYLAPNVRPFFVALPKVSRAALRLPAALLLRLPLHAPFYQYHQHGDHTQPMTLSARGRGIGSTLICQARRQRGPHTSSGRRAALKQPP